MSLVVEDDEDLVGGPRSWQEELASLVETSGIQYPEYYNSAPTPTSTLTDADDGFGFGFGFNKTTTTTNGGAVLDKQPPESFRDQAIGFLKASSEMITDLALACKDVLHQILVAHHLDSYFIAKFHQLSHRLAFLNDFLPEDRHPIHAWPIIFFVFIIALSVLCVNTEPQIPRSVPKKVYIHPPSATLVQLPDGRNIAYHEQGVPAERARFSLISPHSFLSSRLAAGIPGIKESLLEEFGVRLITYDLPGFGESDPHPKRNLNTSAMDMLHIADSVGVNDKFWVVGYSGGGIHAWAALNYISDRLAGAAMFSPFVNPYDSSMTKEERYRIWEKWTPKRKLMYFLALRFPSLLTYIFRRSFLSGEHGQLDKWLALSLGEKGMEDLVVTPATAEFVSRLVPGATIHKLPGEGHLSYFCFCDECHRQIFSTLFGTPQGPLNSTVEVDQISVEENSAPD